MIDRTRHVLKAILIAWDILIAVYLMVPKYLLAGGQRPNGRQTISGLVGRAALNGRWWGSLEKPIDWMFEKLGSRRWHCRRTYWFEKDRGIQS